MDHTTQQRKFPVKTWRVGSVRICDGVRSNPEWVARTHRLLKRFHAQNVEWDVPFSQGEGWNLLSGTRRDFEDDSPPDVVISVMQFDGLDAWIVAPKEERSGALVLQPYRWTVRRDAQRLRRNEDTVCQTAVQFEAIRGCLHRCCYCSMTKVIIIPVNPEAVVEHVDLLMAEHPGQTLFKYGASTDAPCFEPDYGISRMLVEHFAEKSREFLMLFTKSDNVDSLLDLDHRGRTIMCWSLSAQTAASEVEPFTPSTSERIQAAVKCQDAGYRVRFRFSPITPTDGWETETEAMVREIFDSGLAPDLITLRTIGWFPYDQFVRSMPQMTIDPHFRAIMTQAAADEAIPVTRFQPLPEAARVEIYTHVAGLLRQVSPKTRISLCWETPDVWAAMQEFTGMTPSGFVCNCGPNCAPPNPLLSEST
jgi:spore photoproduct lyase